MAFAKEQLVFLIMFAWLPEITGFVDSHYDQMYSPCSESLPESQRLKRNCTPLKPMLLHYLKNVVCNDGSPAGYYFRRRSDNPNWLIYLEGGGYCFNKKTCTERLLMSKSRKYSLVSIHGSSKKKFVTGILSTQRKTNPIWWNSNHVYIPYCSSDIWSGNKSASRKGGFSFLGARIIDQVIEDLWQKRGLNRAENLTLAGSSAGGTGVMLNIDRVAENLRAKGADIHVKGIVDSGWFLDNESIKSRNCGLPHGRCTPSDVIKTAMHYWHADLPIDCIRNKTPDKQHLCFFGDELYPYIKSPVFIIQWIYDLAQIRGDNPELERNPMLLGKRRYFQYMAYLGQRVRLSLKPVRSFFAPSCLGHTILTREQWLKARVSSTSLADALHCWYFNSASTYCQSTDNCFLPHCSRYCPNLIETHNGDVPIRRITGDLAI